MKNRLSMLLAGVGMLVGAVPVVAHHSFAAEFDATKPVTVTGTVTKVEWMNPHARFYVDAKNESGEITKWEFELGSPNGLIRQGWTRNSMKPGDSVTVEGYLAKDGSKLGNARSVRTTDGKRLFAGSSADGGPTR